MAVIRLTTDTFSLRRHESAARFAVWAITCRVELDPSAKRDRPVARSDERHQRRLKTRWETTQKYKGCGETQGMASSFRRLRLYPFEKTTETKL
jgi:hypothetical protein